MEGTSATRLTRRDPEVDIRNWCEPEQRRLGLAYRLTMMGSPGPHPAELNANRQAGLDEHGRAPEEWNNPWPGCR